MAQTSVQDAASPRAAPDVGAGILHRVDNQTPAGQFILDLAARMSVIVGSVAAKKTSTIGANH